MFVCANTKQTTPAPVKSAPSAATGWRHNGTVADQRGIQMSEQLWRCGRCLEQKPAAAFNTNCDPITNERRPPAYICKSCLKEYARLRRERMTQGVWAGAAIRTKPPHVTYKK